MPVPTSNVDPLDKGRSIFMTDLKNPKLIFAKGWLFLAILLISITAVLLETRSWRVAALLLLIVWSSARFYYFMFYVIEKYVDSNYRFAGITSFVRYLLERK
jgi:hypothetical protein